MKIVLGENNEQKPRASWFLFCFVFLPTKSLQSYLTLCNTIWIAMPSSRGSSRPRDGTHVSHISALTGSFLTSSGKLTISNFLPNHMLFLRSP